MAEKSLEQIIKEKMDKISSKAEVNEEVVDEEETEELIETAKEEMKKDLEEKKVKEDDHEEDDEEDDDEEMESKSKKENKKVKEDEDEEDDDDEEMESKSKKENKNKKETKEEPKKESKSYEDIEIDVKDDVEALTSGDDMSDEFKKKAATIFEAAVKAKVIDVVKAMEKDLEEKYSKQAETDKQEIVDNVDKYLDYVSEQWMKENELAVEVGLKEEITNNFMTGLKNLFEEHYIDIPDEKIDLISELQSKVEEQEEALNKEINESIETKKELVEYKKKDIFNQITTDLVDTEIEKLKKLSDTVEFEDSENYKEKLNTIKENYFKKSTSETTDSKETAGTNKEIQDNKTSVDSYVQAITKSIKK
tara:strand:- start:1566 stop:2657 length:1092 start_codon:yes stop_codon:yes gene_type:complete